MSVFQVDHIALTVESLRQAENFYMRLFGLEPLYREGRTESGWLRLPGADGWEEAARLNIELVRVCLEREGFRIVLILKASEASAAGRIHHVCLQMKPEDARTFRRRAEALDCCAIKMDDCGIAIEDPYGVRWGLAISDQ